MGDFTLRSSTAAAPFAVSLRFLGTAAATPSATSSLFFPHGLAPGRAGSSRARSGNRVAPPNREGKRGGGRGRFGWKLGRQEGKVWRGGNVLPRDEKHEVEAGTRYAQ